MEKYNKLKVIRFLLVGGLCYLLALLFLYVFTSVVGLHYLVSAIVAFFLTNIIGYTLNKGYTFEKQNLGYWIGLWKYNVVMSSSGCIVLVFMYVFVDIFHIWYLYANIIITAGTTTYNFILHNNWTFMERS